MSAILPMMTHKSRRENSGLRFQIKMSNTEKSRRAKKKLIAYSCSAPPNILKSTHFFLEFFFCVAQCNLGLMCMYLYVDYALHFSFCFVFYF